MTAAPPPVRRRRYEWCRLDNGFPDLPIWRAVAARARARVHQVVAVALRLECLANRSVPRGSVADMSVAEFASALQLPANAVARIRAALEDPDIGWLDQDFIVDFYERNPDHDDRTAAARQRRRREKLRAVARELGATGPPGVIHSHVTSRRDSVTVTLHQITEKKEAAEAASGVDNPLPDASAWLSEEGLRIVIERMQEPRPLAELRLARWRDQELAGDAHALRAVIEAADEANYMGARFHNLVTDAIRRHRLQASGQGQLRLPPMAARRRG